MRRYSSYRDMGMTGGCVVCSGHGAMKENYYLDDGTYSASQIVIIMVKRYLEGLGKDIYKSLLADLKEPVESNEFRLKLKVRTATPPKGVSPLHEDFCCLMQPCWPSAHTLPKSFIHLLCLQYCLRCTARQASRWETPAIAWWHHEYPGSSSKLQWQVLQMKMLHSNGPYWEGEGFSDCPGVVPGGGLPKGWAGHTGGVPGVDRGWGGWCGGVGAGEGEPRGLARFGGRGRRPQRVGAAASQPARPPPRAQRGIRQARRCAPFSCLRLFLSVYSFYES